MHFDEGKRRLLSGAEDGTVKVSDITTVISEMQNMMTFL